MNAVHTILEVLGIDEGPIHHILEDYFDSGLVEYEISGDEILMVWKDDYAYDDAIDELERDMQKGGARIGYSGYA